MKTNKILATILSVASLMSLITPMTASADEINDANYDYIIGDANLDSKIDIRDAAHIARDIARKHIETHAHINNISTQFLQTARTQI